MKKNPMKSNQPRVARHTRHERRPGVIGVRRLVSRAMFLSCGLSLLLGLLPGSATPGRAAGVQITGQLLNFDVRYPNSLPNDLEIYVYGAGLTINDVLTNYPNPFWGQAQQPYAAGVNTDTSSPAYGLNYVGARYAGPQLPASVGQMLHFGVRLKIGAAVVHQEVWWTLNGQKILRPAQPQVTWISSSNNWLICIGNPTPSPIYVYGPRWFAPATNSALPQLSQLITTINPVSFGAAGWTNLTLPGSVQVFAIPAYTPIYFKVSVTPARPIVFQMAARDVSDAVLPLPSGTTAPNPNDFNGEIGTMSILTTRPTLEFAEDLNGDGVVGIPDFNQLRSRFGQTSPDVSGN